MIQFQYTITDPEGIHARPAGFLVAEAKQHPCSITLRKDDKVGDAKRIFGIMSLIAKQGDTVTVTCDGEGEAEAAEKMKEVLKNHL
ncbi:MAG TPA: HPr family phosphocarrier protein [Candidatus Stercoripulliclostridium merdipullorum]|uniref:HPr family phosphocarrier protein n=1 Tax=Candidatus Stercoripulliclostridium merdipullorum TaxID=2840952 RepID=A0A9D1SX80_9FIRM|nr:HPr family phosphocarrier protein [Candidatus Stercoripulliclostridium merdipullorum]